VVSVISAFPRPAPIIEISLAANPGSENIRHVVQSSFFRQGIEIEPAIEAWLAVARERSADPEPSLEAQIGRAQLEPQLHGLGKDSNRNCMASAKNRLRRIPAIERAAANTTVITPNASAVDVPCQQN
jgi:hypothetical protein